MTDSIEETELLRRIHKSFEYVQKNYDKLATKYKNKLIALSGEEVLATAKTVKELVKKVKRKKIDPAEVYVTSFPSYVSVF